MRKVGLELKVGVFVLLGLLILTGLVMKSGNFNLKPGYEVRLKFRSVNGIESGSPVRLAGVAVGEVKEIRVFRDEGGDTQVEVLAWISQDIYIEDDAKVSVQTLGLLGEKFIEITPGTSGNKTLVHDGTISGKSPVDMDLLIENGSRLITKMETAMDSINELIADNEFKASVKGTFSHADQAAKNFVEMSDDLKDAAKSTKIVMARLRDGEGTIGKLLKDDKMAKNLEAFSEDIKAHPWKLLKRG